MMMRDKSLHPTLAALVLAVLALAVGASGCGNSEQEGDVGCCYYACQEIRVASWGSYTGSADECSLLSDQVCVQDFGTTLQRVEWIPVTANMNLSLVCMQNRPLWHAIAEMTITPTATSSLTAGR